MAELLTHSAAARSATAAAQPRAAPHDRPGAGTGTGHGQGKHAGIDAHGVAGLAGVASEAALAGQLLGCFGDLFSASVEVGYKSDPEPDGSYPPRCMLKVRAVLRPQGGGQGKTSAPPGKGGGVPGAQGCEQPATRQQLCSIPVHTCLFLLMELGT
eukprot:139744-Chlamydomonas_euryale.AAC.2